MRCRLSVVLACAAVGCTSTEGGMVEPPEIPSSAEVWVDPILNPPPRRPPPSPYDSPEGRRYMLGMRLVMLRISMLEAEAGRRVVYDDHFDDRYDWLGRLAATPCSERGCADACRARMHVPKVHCGTGMGEGTDRMRVEVRDCGPPREYAFGVRYEPLSIERIEDETPAG